MPKNLQLLSEPPPLGGGEERARAREGRRNSGNPKTVDEMMELANSLTDSQRAELLAKMALRTKISGKVDQDRDLHMWCEGVYSALQATNGEGSLPTHGPIVFKRALGLPANWGAVRKFLEHNGILEMSTLEKQAAFRVLADLLVRHAKNVAQRMGWPLGPKVIADQSVRLAGIFDLNFPGYAESGLVKMVLRRTRLTRAQMQEATA